jgi:DHA2 family methylenomycin A resistance protein-like MFS transporter
MYIGARMWSRIAFRGVVSAGLLLAGLGLLALGFTHAHTAYGEVWWRLTAIGAGFGLTLSPLTGAAIQAVSPEEGGLASGASSTTRQIGAVLGVAVLGAVVRGRQYGGASFGSSLDTAFTLAGAVTLVSAAFTALFLACSRSVTPAPQERRSSQRIAH